MELNLNVGVSSLPIEPITDEAGNVIFKGFVPYVTIAKVESVDASVHSKGEYKDVTMRELKFTFHAAPLIAGNPQRVLVHEEKITGTKTYSGEVLIDRPIKDVQKNIQDCWSRIAHIVNSCNASPNFKAFADIPAKQRTEFLAIPETGSVAERVAQWNKFCDFIAKHFNEGKTGSFAVDAAGNPLRFWLKVTIDYPKATKFVLPTYVGTGFLEAMAFDAKREFKMPVTLTPFDESDLKRKPKAARGYTPAPGGVPGGAPMNAPGAAPGTPSGGGMSAVQEMLRKAKGGQ